MIAWFVLILFLLLVKMAFGKLDTEKKAREYLITVGVFTALMLSVRGENYGQVYDLRVYMQYFERIGRTEWARIFEISDFEYGFAVLNKLLSYICSHGQTIIVFSSCFSIYAVCRFIYRNTKEVFWAYFFFVTLGTMGFMLTGLRQAIAMSVTLLAVEYAKKRRFFSFILMNAIAISIHSSALIFVIAYFLITSKAIQKNKLWLILIILATIAFAPQIINLGKTISEEVLASDTATYSFNGIVPIVTYAGTVILLLYTANKREKDEHDIGLKMTSMGLGLYFLRFYNFALQRLSFYYTPASALGLADVVGEFKKEKNGLFIEIIFLILSIALFFSRLSSASYADYVFFWSV